MQELLRAGEDEKVKKINLSMLELFYRKAYEKERDFYEQFEERAKLAASVIDITILYKL